jgi:signal transduction histidine kinase
MMALGAGGAFAGFQMFAVSTAWLTRSESVARQALARTNAELTATRELLAENSRVAERLRIARDLHDTLGHHLTALSIQLEVASRLTDGPAAAHIREAHAVARLLLGDVRDVVDKLRDSRHVDLSNALRALTLAPGALQIHLAIPERLDLEDSARAHALLRCVQEIITNTTRHASATNLWITISQGPNGLDLRARDDGRGVDALRWGNGLRGMRERFEEYAGRIEFQSVTGQGFEVRGFMPRSEALA